MGTDVRTLPERVAAVSVGVLWGRRHREPQPELLPVTGVGVAIVDACGGEPRAQSRRLLEGAELARAADRLVELDLPLVGFNLLMFDWIALQSCCEVAPLIERTIDVRAALFPLVGDIVGAEGAGAFPMRGEYGVLNARRLAETNLGFIPAGDDDPLGDAMMAAALWHRFAVSERALIAGRSHALGDDQLALLRGARPHFASTGEWRAAVARRPAPPAYRRRKPHPIAFPRIDQRYV